MITGELKNKIDRIWNDFWAGGIANPLTVIEQITYLLFIKRLDEIQTNKENKANITQTPIADPIYTAQTNHLRWSQFKDKEAQVVYDLFVQQNGVFAFIKNLHTNAESAYARYMKDAAFLIPTPQLLQKVIDKLSDIPMEDRDTKGDVYEYLLSKIASAGQNGQFRTPRHIIKMMVDMMKPGPEDIICDPACGSAGFLVAASEYLREKHKELFHNKQQLAHFNNTMFYGNDFDATMLRIGAMNMMLHGIENPNIDSKDSLSQLNAENEELYTLVLANPPFKGSLDHDAVAKDLLRVVSTKKTELLFLALMLKLLKTGGRCAVIVPDGVLFGSSNTHKALRKAIIDDQKLEAVISMPSGVFKPYAGVSTAVLIFTKTNSGGTEKVWFYDMQADGYSLDDKRTELDSAKHENNNIPDILNRWNNLSTEHARAKTEQSFMVAVADIRANGYDLSINRYKEIVHDEIEYDSPHKIIADIKKIEDEIQQGVLELEAMLNG